MVTAFFPQGVATDNYFCNRTNERKMLKTSIEMHENLVIIAPRRYGKTSLIAQVLKENKFAGASIDFFFALNQSDVKKAIASGVAHIISQLLPRNVSACQKIINKVKELNPKLAFSFLGQKIEIITKQSNDKSLSEILLALDQFALETKKSCVIVLDEFQQIAELKENHAIEAEIRHAVERSQRVSYIFCGSKRHLLNEMFSDNSRPLYHLCDLMTIDRINQDCYHRFLSIMSTKRWHCQLDKDAINEILYLSERHPYYLNALCRHLWRQDSIPSISDVRNTWDDYVSRQSPWIIADLSSLSLNRKRVLMALAQEATKEPQGFDFSSRAGLNPSGVQKSLSDLLKLDLVYQGSDKYYQILDPALAYFIRQNKSC